MGEERRDVRRREGRKKRREERRDEREEEKGRESIEERRYREDQPANSYSSMDIRVTRKILNAILDGSIESVKFTPHSIFQFLVPETVAGVETFILDTRKTWADKSAYDKGAEKLAKMMIDNFKQYSQHSSEFNFEAYGPQLK